MSAVPTRIASAPGELGGCALRARVDAALGDDDAVARDAARRARAARARSISKLPRSRAFTPTISAPSCDRAVELLARRGPRRARPARARRASASSARARASSTSRSRISAASAPAACSSARSLSSREEALAEDRQLRRRARGPQVVERAAEAGRRRAPRARRPPPAANCRASDAGSASPRSSPADGERRLISAIAPSPGAARASRNLTRPPPRARTRRAARAVAAAAPDSSASRA